MSRLSEALNRALPDRFGSRSRSNLFESCERQLANVRSWNEEFGWGFEESDFERLGEPPMWPSERLQAVVLLPRLAVTSSTAAVLWQIAARQQRQSWCHEDLQPETWTAFGEPGPRELVWKTIDLGGYWTPLETVMTQTYRSLWRLNPERDPQDSAGLEVLAAAAHFPRWARAMDGCTVPNVVMPGLLCHGPDIEPGSVPVLCFGQTEPVLLLSCWEPDERDGYMALGLLLPN